MNENSSPQAFILGCERSGSTWLSNVLDAHPDVEFFMEPFANYTNLFPGFASRNLYTDHHCSTIANVVTQGYDNLQSAKYLLFYKRHKHLYWKKVDSVITNLFTHVGSLKYIGIPMRIKQFQLLNLNLKNVPMQWQIKKNERAKLIVTKELRLNFKVGLIQRVFPRAKIIIIVRHPGAQVTSILKLFQRSNLKELRNSLLTLYDDIRTSDRFDKYSKYYMCLDSGPDKQELLLLWWLINYETVIDDCKRYGVNYRVVFHEDLSEFPEDEYQKIFSFLELNYSQEVRTYITQSTVGSRGRNNKSVISPVDTFRDSSKHSKESISNIDDELKLSIANLFERFDVIDELSRYRGS